MTILWAPWRMEYILGEKPDGCIFCDKPAQGPDHRRENLILAEAPRAFVMMNRYPYAYAHLMVIPRVHVSVLDDLPPEDFDALWRLVRASVTALRAAVNPQGMNLGLNLGRPAGAGIDEHLHVHIVPRWVGDTNYMPVLADVRVMPEHLDDIYERLLPSFAGLTAGDGGTTDRAAP